MRRGTLASSTAILIAVACSPEERLALEWGDTCADLVVVAIVDDESGEVQGVERLSGCDALRIAAPANGYAVAWRIPQSSVLSPKTGLTADDELVSKAVVGTARSEPLATCGRCLAPMDIPFVVAHAGSTCPLPLGLESKTWRIDDGRASPVADADIDRARVRGSVRIGWPGECECTPPLFEEGTQSKFEVCPLIPVENPWGSSSYNTAVSDGGWIGSFGQLHGLVVDPSGTKFETSQSDVMQSIVRAAVAVEGPDAPRFFVFPEERSLRSVPYRVDLFEVVDGALVHRPKVLEMDDIESIKGAVPLADPPRRALVFGRGVQGGSVVGEPYFGELVWDDPNQGVPVLVREPLFGQSRGRDAVAATKTSSGTGIAISDVGEILVRSAAASGAWRVAGQLPGTDEQTAWNGPTSVASAAALGQTAFVCGTLSGERFFQRYALSLDGTIEEEQSIDLGPEVTCQTLTALPDQSAVRARLDNGEWLDLAASGQTLATYATTAALPGFADAVGAGVYASARGPEIVVGNLGATVYLRKAGEPRARIAIGPDYGISFDRPLVRGADDQERVLLRTREPVRIRDPGGRGCNRFEIDPVGEGARAWIGPEGAITAAAPLDAGRYVVFGFEGGRASIRWLVDRNGMFEPEGDLIEIEGPSRVASRVVVLNERTLVALTNDGEIYALSEPFDPAAGGAERFRELTVEWVDPMTGEGSAKEVFWEDISTSNGIAWVSGGSALARVVPAGGSEVRVEGYWLDRAAKTQFGVAVERRRDSFVSSVNARCADLVQFSSHEAEPGTVGSHVYAWQLGPSAAKIRGCDGGLGVVEGAVQTQLRSSELHLCAMPIFAGDVRAQLGIEMIGLFETKDGIHGLSRGGYIYKIERDPLPYVMNRDWSFSNGRLWFSHQRDGFVGVATVR